MRTTVTIEPDIAERLKRRARDQETSFKATLNETLRRGLRDEGSGERKPFVQETSNMGPPRFDLGKANQLADQLEDEEIIRKLEQGR